MNDLRFQYNYWNNHNTPAVSSDCSAPCVAGSLPNVFYFQGSNQQAIGPNFNAPQGRNTRRFEIRGHAELAKRLASVQVRWRPQSHQVRWPVGILHTDVRWRILTDFHQSHACGALPPATFNALFPTLPTQLKTDADVLNLPVLNLNSSIFSGVGVGGVSLPAAYDYNQNKNYNQYRTYFQDVWKVRENLTVNYGLAWNAQIGFYNSDLPKPQLLAPILGTGSNNLGPTVNNTKEFQPALRFRLESR